MDERDKSNNLIEAISNLRVSIGDYIGFKISKITLSPAKTYNENRNTNVKQILNNIKDSLKNYLDFLPDFQIPKIVDALDKGASKYEIKIKDESDKLSIKDMVTIEYWFKYYTILEEGKATKKTGFKKPSLTFSSRKKVDINKETFDDFKDFAYRRF